ncbi:hypothetical protein Pcinc_040494 [Petrolisthes cinctipes]|uniref:Uncharacterized protein n=1 Tax=Petrolisthes cinctipes TaxID=88211 RepID=A0AAE1EJG9_PETCI|nr:hypothetical protein Pcinc_040494 [Petrolisthes cinctipes]
MLRVSFERDYDEGSSKKHTILHPSSLREAARTAHPNSFLFPYHCHHHHQQQQQQQELGLQRVNIILLPGLHRESDADNWYSCLHACLTLERQQTPPPVTRCNLPLSATTTTTTTTNCSSGGGGGGRRRGIISTVKLQLDGSPLTLQGQWTVS